MGKSQRIMLFRVFIFVFITGNVFVKAMTDKEVKVHFTKLLMQCAIDHPIKFADLLQLQQLQTPKKTEAKCLLMCAYKKLNTMNEKGLFDLEENYKNAELVANGDQDRLINGKKLVDTCIKVNDAEVSDGEKGCDRAGLMFACVVEEAPKLGFAVR